MWPYLEQDLSDCLDPFARAWTSFDGVDVTSPEKLVELTVEKAWGSGREYWMRCASTWVSQMAKLPNFGSRTIRDLASRMLSSDYPAPEVKRALEAIVSD